MSAKKPQPHTKGNLAPEYLDTTPRVLSRQGRGLAHTQSSTHEPSQSITPEAASDSARLSHAYPGRVMPNALERQQNTAKQRPTQSGQAMIGSATATARPASTPHAARVTTQLLERPGTQPSQPVTHDGQVASARPQTSGQSSSTGRQISTLQRPYTERLENILDDTLKKDQQYQQSKKVSGDYQQLSSSRRLPRTREAQWYAYPVAGSNTSLLLGIVVCLVLLLLFFVTPLGGPLGLYSNQNPLISFFRVADNPSQQTLAPQITPDGEHSIVGMPTINAQQIDTVLRSYGSPAAGQGKAFYELGRKYNIDPAYALAFFIHESSAGTNTGWAGIKSDGSLTHNVGNIICAGYKTCYNRFRDYASWEEGIEDWYRLLSVEYIEGRGTSTVEQIIPIYAPSFENDVPAYVNAVTSLVNEWRERGVQ